MEASFRFTEGDYAQFRGYVFMYGKPTKVTDRATIEELKRSTVFEEVKDEAQETPAKATVLMDECPKCGRIVKKGKYFHQKYCKGKP